MTGDSAPSAPPARLGLGLPVLAAWAAAVFACVVLLGCIRYCPTYEAGKTSLIYLWYNTYADDIYKMWVGLWTGKSQETQSGEASSSEWNYCLLVPFITVWLVWRQWPRVVRLPLAGSNVGYGLLGFGFFLYLGGFLAESYYVGMIAMEFVYAGLIVLFAGWQAMRLLLFPTVFLLFMWPYNFMEDVALDLRLVMSALSHHFLLFIGIPNLLSGTAIISPPDAPIPFGIDIADPCSGIRSLFALVMIAALFGFLAYEKIWQQLVIVSLSVPLVLIGNLVRICLLALGTIHFGEDFALGTNEHPSTFHESAGFLVYFINFGGLIGVGTLLGRFSAPPPTHDD